MDDRAQLVVDMASTGITFLEESAPVIEDWHQGQVHSCVRKVALGALRGLDGNLIVVGEVFESLQTVFERELVHL